MAKKVNAMQLAQISRAREEVTNRLPTPVSPALYLMQLRLPKWRIQTFKRKLPVATDVESAEEIEHPVKITRVG